MRDLKDNSNINETNNILSFKKTKATISTSKTRRNGHQKQRRPTTKYGNNKHDKLHRANHENIKKLWRTVENTTRYQSDPIGHVINLSKKTFTKGTFQLLNKNLNFIPTPKVYNQHKQKQPPRGVPKKRCSENMQQIYRRTLMPRCDFNKVAKQL